MTKEQSGREAYPDIIDLPHHQSIKHKHMSLYDRAAQFSPFAALSGYDDMVAEEARQTGEWHEREIEILNIKMEKIASALDAGENPLLSFTVFVPDKKKAGGEYEEVTGTVKKIDMFEGVVVLFAENMISDGQKIEIKQINDIHGELVDNIM